ncbi:Low temperature requirement A [Drechmeria coniospora]|uniref:Low temperature requirement A n=1 Tax=Drechmeria coniospora TaxID=98403 RepID=A0A151GQ45_DRECN|nr:Low temperature requirement A [Drechmeria coniospora]KYK59229.1 Low temperature requirement A [Drechmeria coniospora]
MSMSDYGEHGHPPSADKLRIFASPVMSHTGSSLGDKSPSSVHSADNHQGETRIDHRRVDDDLPKFKRYLEPTLLEIFYDLFFAANYNVFSDTQHVTSHGKFKAYVGYFCLLWLTWFLVTMFDVRYVTDSIFSRVTRAIQLGVLVGFTVVVPNFNPSEEQHQETMQAMSLILCFSRLCLAFEYGTTLWHVRKYKKARLPLYLQIALHAIASAIYLGVTFAFTSNSRSRVYMTWYIVSGIESLATLLLTNFSPVLSITKTHIMKRMTLMTIMIMGDGIVQVAKEVVIIVKNPNAWDSTTIGLVTAAAATIYFVFLIYFDWLRNSFYLPALRQQLWTFLHLPFHLSLVLFMQGFTQYLLWSKIMVQFSRLNALGDPRDAAGNIVDPSSSIAVRDFLNQSVLSFFADYPPKIANTMDTVNEALQNVTKIPDAFWPKLNGVDQLDLTNLPVGFESAFNDFVAIVSVLVSAMANALFGAFGIEVHGEIANKNTDPAKDLKGSGLQFEVTDKTQSRYRLVFVTGYVSTGCTIIFMLLLAIVSRTTPLKAWPIIRLVIIFLLALGTALVSLLWYSPDKLDQFLTSPWVMPTITFVWTIVLIITHINGEGVKRNAYRFKRRRQGDRSNESGSLPRTSTSKWAPGEGEQDSLDRESQRHVASAHDVEVAGAEQSAALRARPAIGDDTIGGVSELPPTSYNTINPSTEKNGESPV